MLTWLGSGWALKLVYARFDNALSRREVYFFRDQRGLEVDFVVPSGAQELVLVVAKASRTVYPDAARSALTLARSISNHPTRCIVVHATTAEDKDDAVLALGARAMSISGLLHALRGSRK
jgi:phosphoribosylamine-glycine ligase